MGAREDDDHWNNKDWTVGKDAEAWCDAHGDESMYYDTGDGEWYCGECEEDDEKMRTYTYG